MNKPLTLTNTSPRFPHTVDDNTFFYFPENEIFMRGRHGLAHVANPLIINGQANWQVKTVSLLLFVIVYLGVGVTMFVYLPHLLTLVIAIPAAIFMSLFFLGRNTVLEYFGRRNNAAVTERFLQQGDIIKGRLSSCIASVNTNAREEGGFHVTATYDFINPHGELRIGSVKTARPALNGKQLPVPGTPIYVLYLNDTEYYLL